jgi:cell division protein FtsZ
MPAMDEFPAIAQKQIAAQQSRVSSIAEQSSKKKMGIFERLATVGMGRRDEAPRAAPAQRAEPAMTARVQPQRFAPPAPQPVAQEEQGYEDDQLAIPAFLRRQAHG